MPLSKFYWFFSTPKLPKCWLCVPLLLKSLFEKIPRGSHVHTNETCKSSEFALSKKKKKNSGKLEPTNQHKIHGRRAQMDICWSV